PGQSIVAPSRSPVRSVPDRAPLPGPVVVVGWRVVVVAGPYDWMSVDVDVTASTHAHSVNARSFPEDVGVTPMSTVQIVLPLRGGAEVFAFVMCKRFRRL